MPIQNREEFKNYCLRRLGFPVIQIEVAPEQIEDRIDDALTKYFDYHFDGSEEIYYIHLIENQDVTNNYIELPDEFFAVDEIVPISQDSLASGSGIFNVTYQFLMSDFWGSGGFVGGNLSYIELLKSYLATVRHRLSPVPSFQFNRKTNKLVFTTGIANLQRLAPRILIHGYKKLDVEKYPDIWEDEFLKDYATALIKKQWGENLKKYTNLNLPGGIQIDGKSIYDEAQAEVERLEQKLISNLSLPPRFFVG
jgi:hypothetical protein